MAWRYKLIGCDRTGYGVKNITHGKILYDKISEEEAKAILKRLRGTKRAPNKRLKASRMGTRRDYE